MENTLNGTLNLDADAKRIRINEGYNDTMNKLMPIVEMVKFIEEKEEEETNPRLYKVYNYSKKIVDKFMSR